MCKYVKNGFLLRRSMYLCASDYLLLPLCSIQHSYCKINNTNNVFWCFADRASQYNLSNWQT